LDIANLKRLMETLSSKSQYFLWQCSNIWFLYIMYHHSTCATKSGIICNSYILKSLK